jgi:fimbrial chaperone protein
MRFLMSSGRRAALLSAVAVAVAAPALAADFSVTPIRADFQPGAMSETITVSNESKGVLRVSMKVMAWSQDQNGKDVYTESNDLVYFPRVMDVQPGAKRLVRVGARAPAQGAERTYRLFIEEAPPASAGAPTAVNFYFRFGVPIFVPPAGGKAQPEVMEPALQKGKLSLAVRNAGNVHFRPTRLVVGDGAGWSQEMPGWYSLAGTTRTYETAIPPDVCRKARTLTVRIEATDANFDRKLDVTPASCS